MKNKTFDICRFKLYRFIIEAIEVIGKFDPEAIRFFTKLGWAPENVMKPTFDELPEDLTGQFREIRLNDAGFKMFLCFYGDGRFDVRIGGDQTDSHKEAFLILTMLLQKYELLAPEYFAGATAPLSEAWMEANLLKLKVWGYVWMRQHSKLVPESVR